MLRAVIIVFAVVSFVVLANETEKKVTKTDWCEITVPTSARAGESIVVEVKVLKSEPEMKLKGDLHHFNQTHGYAGFAVWGGAGKDVKAGDVVTFTYTVKTKDGCPYVGCIFWLSKDGVFSEQVTKATSALMEVVE